MQQNTYKQIIKKLKYANQSKETSKNIKKVAHETG